MYFKMIWISIRSQMQYRASFTLMMISNFLIGFIEYLGVWAYFTRFGSLGQWSLAEVGVFYAMGNIAFALSEAIFRGFDVFSNHVRTGDFDRILLRPRGITLQILGSEIQLLRVGRLAQGIMILAWSLPNISLAWGLPHWLLFAEAMLGGMLLFASVMILQATCSFWSIQSLEVWNVLSYGGVQALQYPMDIYKTLVRWVFMYLLPLAAINYWPCAYLLGKDYCPVWWSFAAPVLGLAFLVGSMQVWRIGVAHYHSTGS